MQAEFDGDRLIKVLRDRFQADRALAQGIADSVRELERQRDEGARLLREANRDLMPLRFARPNQPRRWLAYQEVQRRRAEARHLYREANRGLHRLKIATPLGALPMRRKLALLEAQLRDSGRPPSE